MQRFRLPAALVGVFFDGRWETSRIWSLQTPVTSMQLAELWWHAELPVWSTVLGQPNFDLAPLEVLSARAVHKRHWDRIWRVDPSYPLELFQNGGRWVIVDGYHRLVRHHLQGNTALPVRLHPDDDWAEVLIT